MARGVSQPVDAACFFLMRYQGILMQNPWRSFAEDLREGFRETIERFKMYQLDVAPVIADENQHLEWLIPVIDAVGRELGESTIYPFKTHRYLRFRYGQLEDDISRTSTLWVESLSPTSFRVWHIPSGGYFSDGNILVEGIVMDAVNCVVNGLKKLQ